MTIDLPGVEDPRVVDAVVELTRRAGEGFTGSVEFDFNEGVPHKVRVTAFRRLGIPKLQRRAAPTS